MAEKLEKQTFGGAGVALIRPTVDLGNKALNVHLTFDEALKLHFAIGQALARIGRYNRSTSAGKRSTVNLCLFVGKGRVTVNEGELPKNPRPLSGAATAKPTPLMDEKSVDGVA
jgi:hypothetical protein